jgi:hypothetical protein
MFLPKSKFYKRKCHGYRKRSGIETKKIACFGRQIIPVPSVMLVLSPSIASQSDSQFGIYPTIAEGSDESTHS